MIKPTLTPSIDVRTGHYSSSHQPGDECWCGKNYAFSCYHCHLFVTDGKLAFQTDCSHALAGQTVDMVEWDP